MQEFENGIAIVTSGGMEIGRALCEELAQRGVCPPSAVVSANYEMGCP